MTMEEWNALLNKLMEAWEQVAITVRQAADTLAKIFESIDNKEKTEVKKNVSFTPCSKKNQYLKTYTSIYRVERRIQKHLPYQRRNY